MDSPEVAAVIAAAGRSTRMGEPKQLLPWGEYTVLESVAANLAEAGARPIVCVVGHMAARMEAILQDTPVDIVHNPNYAEGEMLASYQAGVRRLSSTAMSCIGTLLALGDQPQIPGSTIARVVEQAKRTPSKIVVPSFNMRRGHPIFLPRLLWSELLALGDRDTLRTLMRRHERDIVYIAVQTDTILRDLDTPADYQVLRP